MTNRRPGPYENDSNADLVNRAIANLIELERRVGKGGRVSKLIEELLRLPERNAG
jgi:hypothetical protein